MIEEQAIVVDREGQYVWVQTQRQSSCGQCSVKSGCGTQVLSKVLGNKVTHVRCLNYKDARIGDRVVIALEESVLLSGSFMIYLFPLISMILLSGLAVFMAQIWWPERVDLFSVLAAFSGLFLGLYFSQQWAVKNHIRKRYEPIIVKNSSQLEWPLQELGKKE